MATQSFKPFLPRKFCFLEIYCLIFSLYRSLCRMFDLEFGFQRSLMGSVSFISL